jgi:large subunit ribosomal protein L13
VSETESNWHVLDANGKALGRLATNVTMLLQGKHKADYSRHLPNGDFVIVINAVLIGVTGNKKEQKRYYRHTGFVGHLREESLSDALEKHPERVIERAVKGMLPHNRLGRKLLRRLKVYRGDAHPHQAQVNHGQSKAKASVSSQRSSQQPVAVQAGTLDLTQQGSSDTVRQGSPAGRKSGRSAGAVDQKSSARLKGRRPAET